VSLQTALRLRVLGMMIRPGTQRLRRRLAELRRRVTRRPHQVSVFLALDDPYSYLLSLYLRDLGDGYDVELDIRLAQACGDAFRPFPELLGQYAERDCERLARELGVPFLDKGRAPPVEHRRALVEALAGISGRAEFEAELLQDIAYYWRGDTEAVARRASDVKPSEAGKRLLEQGREHLVALGHYNTATLHYGGEWYWGIDRLHYLVDRLEQLGLRRASASNARLLSLRRVMQASLPVARPSTASRLPVLELFHSFRSPYSYLSLRRVFAIADAFGIRLSIRPVLPMVMRGMQLPRRKLLYIAKDAGREAQRLQVPFGRFADPIGKGVERCMAVFQYSLGEKRERDFVINAGEAIWARGIDVATDKGMRKVTGRTGLFWPDVVAAMQDDAWRTIVERNRESMMESGCWGVPTLRIGDFAVWGQDRDWLLARHLEELCDSGEGILV
jgi:2-hydroxychromene-2-carboxylate isomerase